MSCASFRDKQEATRISPAQQPVNITRDWTRAFLAFIIVPNLPFWLLRSRLPAAPGLVNVDYILLGVAALFLNRLVPWIAATLIFLELVQIFAAIYYFSVIDFLRSSKYLLSWPLTTLIVWTLLAIAIVSALALLIDRIRPRKTVAGSRSSARFLLLIGVLLVAVDAVGGHNYLLRAGNLELPNVARSSIFATGFQIGRAHFSSPYFGDRRADSAFSLARAPLVVSERSSNIVLVVVESWGLPVEDKLRRQLEAPYNSSLLQQRYQVISGTTKFNGSTVGAETRELCNNYFGLAIRDRSADQLRTCLPARLKAAGYIAEAVHGFDGRMYDRLSWYKTLGFDRLWFEPDLRSEGLPQCPGAFPGTCDAAVASWIGRRLVRESDRKHFIYWVTLNSHLPISSLLAQNSTFDCASIKATQDQSSLCLWARVVDAVNRATASLAVRNDLPPTTFVIVGDHAPPFWRSQLRAAFSQTEVPFIALIPLAGAPKAAPLAHRWSCHTEITLCL